jgi:hypothetical protein
VNECRHKPPKGIKARNHWKNICIKWKKYIILLASLAAAVAAFPVENFFSSVRGRESRRGGVLCKKSKVLCAFYTYIQHLSNYAANFWLFTYLLLASRCCLLWIS